MTATSQLFNLTEIRKFVSHAKHLLVLTGAGLSAESGIPTFRGEGGLWRTYRSEQLATMDAFRKNPALVWEFYNYRRELVLSKQPNAAHLAIAECEYRFEKECRKVTIITQNVDELHKKAGSKNVIELHGSLFRTKCMECYDIKQNYENPICVGLEGKGAPTMSDSSIPISNLPHCKQDNCNGLLRPGVIWFGEELDANILQQSQAVLDESDLCMIIGTSSIVYPAASFAPYLAKKSVPVVEFNIDKTVATDKFRFHFQGPCAKTVPEALAAHEK